VTLQSNARGGGRGRRSSSLRERIHDHIQQRCTEVSANASAGAAHPILLTPDSRHWAVSSQTVAGCCGQNLAEPTLTSTARDSFHLLQVSSMSHSSPNTQRSADSLPLIIPHSKSSHGPVLPFPNRSSVFLAAASAPSQTESIVVF
jgi:hypothetical protein